MRCSRKSTTWRGELPAALGAAFVLFSCTAARAGEPAVWEVLVSDAVRQAVAERMGADASVTVQVSGVQVSPGHVPASEPLVAVLDPAARAGNRLRVGLVIERDGRRLRVGQADALVRVALPHVRATAALPRGTWLDDASVESVTDDVGVVPLRRLPRTVTGGRTLRRVAVGEVLVAAAVSMPPLVRSGDVVVVRVVGPGLDVRGRAVAAQSGEIGDRIRVVNPESGRALQAQVVARGEVEVSHGR